jgi:hypothetical protein
MVNTDRTGERIPPIKDPKVEKMYIACEPFNDLLPKLIGNIL